MVTLILLLSTLQERYSAPVLIFLSLLLLHTLRLCAKIGHTVPRSSQLMRSAARKMQCALKGFACCCVRKSAAELEVRRGFLSMCIRELCAGQAAAYEEKCLGCLCGKMHMRAYGLSAPS
eukprot:1158531-Pelagomonas_calceolata.AAC.5